MRLSVGLEGLKQLLRSFEWLMERLMPRAKAHLEVCFCQQCFCYHPIISIINSFLQIWS